jgi:hypothetical protein
VHLVWKILGRLPAERLLRRVVVQHLGAPLPGAAEDVRVNAGAGSGDPNS